MNFKRILYTDLGRIIMSILLGLGFATIFKKVCTDKNCMTYHGPVISEMEGKIYKHDNKCYSYSSNQVTCDKSKNIMELSNPLHTNKQTPPPTTEPKGFFG